jgi:CO dehydrogenase/acetyl-CoA synthase gamma subunit (corrinoid Fe-S protein)
MRLRRIALFRLRQRSLLRGVLLSLAAMAASLRLAGFPDESALHASNWQILVLPFAGWGMAETARCLSRKWSLYHAGVLILLYTDLMIVALVLFLWLYL